MKSKLRMIISVLVIVAITTLLLFVTRSKKSISVVEGGAIKEIDVGSIEFTPTDTENDNIANLDVKYIDTTTRDMKIEEILDILVAESTNAPPIEKSLIGRRRSDGVLVTNTWFVPKAIPVDTDSIDVTEYLQIAYEKVKNMNIPDDCKPIVEVHGTSLVITFPIIREMPMPGGDFYAQVIIDIKTKVARVMLSV